MLNKWNKFLGGFNAKHKSIESLLQYFLSLNKEKSIKLFIVANGNNFLLQLQRCHFLLENLMC